MVLLLALAGCAAPSQVAPSSRAAARSALAAPGAEVTFVGMCDASAAVALSTTRMIVADDEDNILRVYDTRGGEPLSALDLSPHLELPLGKKQQYPETDLEAGTTIGDRALWLTSHGRSSRGKLRPERLRLFSTSLDDPPRVVGRVYTQLLADLLADPRVAAFDLADAAERAPKDVGGFNLEGMTASPDHRLLIGVRNPVPQGRALLLSIANPLAIFDGAPPVFGDPVLLDLGGRGIRALSWWRGRYLIAAGSPTGEATPGPALYTWDGAGAPEPLPLELGALNPEALFVLDALDQILVLSDDGTVERDGVACKDRERAGRSFRAAWVTIPGR